MNAVVRGRSYWAAALAVAYAAFAGLRAGGNAIGWVFLVALPVALVLVWVRTAHDAEPQRSAHTAASAARACATGTAVWIAASPALDTAIGNALGNAGAMVASIAALWALARLPGERGMLPEDPAARRLDAAAFGSLFWTVAVVLPAVRAFAPDRAAGLDAIADDYATTTASIASLGVMCVALVRARRARALELGAGDRALAALSLAILALGVGLAVGALRVARPERVLPATTCAAALVVSAAATTRRPDALGRVLRVAVVLAITVTPVALGAIVALSQWPTWAGITTLVACAGAASGGLLAAWVARTPEERAIGAESGARREALWQPARAPNAPWLGRSALIAATEAMLLPDPDEALERALFAMGASFGNDWRAPAIYRLQPPERVTVDRAGFAHVAAATLPENLVPLAMTEPHGVLRIEVLNAAAVRKPEVRPLVAWLEEHEADAIVVLRDGGASGAQPAATPGGAAAVLAAPETVGVLEIPRVRRRAPMSLADVIALRRLGDRLAALTAVSAMLARSRLRELEARARAEAEGREAERLAQSLNQRAGRLRAIAEMLRRPATVAAYSPAARTTLDALERRGEQDAPIALVVPPGLDPVPWAAVAHLASSRKDGPFVIVDAAGERGVSTVEAWRDPVLSPLVAATEGTLVLLDAHALSPEVQRYIAAAASPEIGIAVTLPSTVDALVATGQVEEHLADRLGDRAVPLPPLAARPEDLRALVLDKLVRIGVRLRGKPMGVSPQALAALTEHDWPGNDAEMESVLVRAALATTGELLDAAALAAVGFSPSEEQPDAQIRLKRPRGRALYRRSG